jgi:hypothetical protein
VLTAYEILDFTFIKEEWRELFDIQRFEEIMNCGDKAR